MNDILGTILQTDLEERVFQPERTLAYQEALRHLNTYLDKVDGALGRTFHEELYNSIMLLITLQQRYCFHHGFHLSGRLLGELLTPRL